jgi:hypothetical protein
MEFRIAPLLLAVLNTLFLGNCVINSSDATLKQALIGFGMILLAIGSSRSHHYYSKPFLTALYSLSILCAGMVGYVLYCVYR